MSRIDKFFIRLDRFSDTQLVWGLTFAIVFGWSLFTAVAAAVLL